MKTGAEKKNRAFIEEKHGDQTFPYGGQAVIEGVMIRGERIWCAVRKARWWK